MLQDETISVSEGIDINKTSASKKCLLCQYWYFKNVAFKFKPHVCNKCHGVLMTAYKLNNYAILSVVGVDFRGILWSISRDEAVNRLNDSVLEDKVSCNVEFGANKTPIEVIKEDPFGGTYFRDIYSSINGKWYRNSWKEFDQLKNIDQKFSCSDYYDLSVHKCGVKCGKSLRFWENMGSINEIDPYEWFQWYFRYWLGRGSKDDERQINRWVKTVSSFKGKLVKMIEDSGSKCDDYSISPKTRQILLHWGYELTEKDFFNDLTN